jgi:hypothetical protein
MPGTLLTSAESSGVVVFSLKGASTALEMGRYMDAMQALLDKRREEIRKIVFDLSASDPVINAAGRIFDIAVQCRKELSPHDTAVEMTMPRQVYDDLQRTDNLPLGVDLEVIVHGVRIVIVESTYSELEPVLEKREDPIKRLQYTGKVRELTGDRITVSLFTEEGEVVGELLSGQFPGRASEGQVFIYKAAVTEGGKTEVIIELVQERDLPSDEFLEIWERTKQDMPGDDAEF